MNPGSNARLAGSRDTAAELVLAGELLASGRAGEAVAAYEAVLLREPQLWRARYLLTLGLMQQHEYDAAVEQGQRALIEAGEDAQPPERAEMLTTVAVALNEAERSAQALEVASMALALAPAYPHALAACARALGRIDRVDEAIATARKLLSLASDTGMPHALLGELLMEQGRLVSAISSFERALKRGYETPEMRSRLGLARQWLGDTDAALAELRRAVELAPDWAGGHSNLGGILSDCGSVDAAIHHHRIAVELAPDDPGRHNNLAIAFLAHGELARGWDEYEWGLEGSTRGSRRDLPVSHWDGADPSGRTVLVYREQGVGDEIMFASCLDDLIGEAAHVVLECDPRLVTVFTRSFPAVTVRADTRDPVTRAETLCPDVVDFDLALPIGSLPSRYRRSLDAFPDRRSYLQPDEHLVGVWRSWLEDVAPDGWATVGISWRGKLTHNERRLEYTRLAEWEPVFAVPGVQFVNLQYDQVDAELDEAADYFHVEIARPPALDLMNDFENVAALACALDAVICPQNALGHFTGALGVPTLMMGNRFWWNNLGATRNQGAVRYPWLPAVELVTRIPGDPWAPVVAEVARRLSALNTDDRSAPTTQLLTVSADQTR